MNKPTKQPAPSFGRPNPLAHAVQGLLMGTADIIPGVSGGTIALIVGIYDRLLANVGYGVQGMVALLKGQPKRCWRHLATIEWLFIGPLIAGIGAAILVSSHFIPSLLATYPLVMNALFFGLIVGSLPTPIQAMQERVQSKHLALMLIGAVFAFFLVGLRHGADVTNPSLVGVFISGMIAIIAMILPGISGSYLLVTMGMYVPTLHALKERNILYLTIFIAGATIGLTLFSTLLAWLLRTHRAVTMAVLTGLMVGSLRTLWPWTGAPTLDEVTVGLVSMVCGVIVVRLLAKIEHYVTVTS